MTSRMKAGAAMLGRGLTHDASGVREHRLGTLGHMLALVRGVYMELLGRGVGRGRGRCSIGGARRVPRGPGLGPRALASRGYPTIYSD